MHRLKSSYLTSLGPSKFCHNSLIFHPISKQTTSIGFLAFFRVQGYALRSLKRYRSLTVCPIRKVCHKYSMRQLYKQFTQALPGSYERKFGARAAILCGAPDNFRGVASGCPLFRGKNVRKKRGGDAKSVRCSEFRGGRFSEVANVLL